MVGLLNDTDRRVRANIANALRYLCFGHAGSKDAIRESGGIAALVIALSDTCREVRIEATKTLRSLRNDIAVNGDAIREGEGIAAMTQIFNSEDTVVCRIAPDLRSHHDPVSDVYNPKRRRLNIE
jgi:hypothetical protein